MLEGASKFAHNKSSLKTRSGLKSLSRPSFEKRVLIPKFNKCFSSTGLVADWDVSLCEYVKTRPSRPESVAVLAADQVGTCFKLARD